MLAAEQKRSTPFAAHLTDPPPLPPIPVLKRTIAALLPGAGHALAGLPRATFLLYVSFVGGALLSLWHLVWGIPLFESALGAFLFRVLLRGVIILFGFSVIDAYFRSTESPAAPGPRRRLAILLNLLLPGTGYFIARAWIRAGTGLLLFSLVLYFAKVSSHPYLDLIYVAMQLIMGGLVYQHLVMKEKGAASDPRSATDRQTQLAQVIVLVALLVSVVASGVVVQQSLPVAGLRPLTPKDLQATATDEGILFSISHLGVSLTVFGPGWRILPQPSLPFLFAAKQGDVAFLRLARQPMPPFIKHAEVHLREKFEQLGLVHQKSLALALHGAVAMQLRFSGEKTAYRGDHWIIAVPQKGFAYVLWLYCRKKYCPQLAPLLEQSRDSFTLTPAD